MIWKWSVWLVACIGELWFCYRIFLCVFSVCCDYKIKKKICRLLCRRKVLKWISQLLSINRMTIQKILITFGERMRRFVIVFLYSSIKYFIVFLCYGDAISIFGVIMKIQILIIDFKNILPQDEYTFACVWTKFRSTFFTPIEVTCIFKTSYVIGMLMKPFALDWVL